MSASDDAQQVVDQLDELHTRLAQAWQRASNAGDYTTAKTMKSQADRAGDQLIAARQNLLAAIDSGKDVTELLAKMAGLSDKIKAQQQKISDGTAVYAELSGVLDTMDQVVALAKQIAG